MPFLRFSRDKRGYENTYLCHTFLVDGASELRLLYWFRTPSNVEIGRLALDSDSIRNIEKSNPELAFDWNEILKAKPAPVSEKSPGRSEQRPARRRGRAAPPSSPALINEASTGKASGVVADSSDSAPSREGASLKVSGDTTSSEDIDRHVVLALTTEAGLAQLRDTYADIQKQIETWQRDSTAGWALEERAALLDPDSWNSVEEARERMAGFNETATALRKALHWRRRSRGRGPRRRASQDSSSQRVASVEAGEQPAKEDQSSPKNEPPEVDS